MARTSKFAFAACALLLAAGCARGTDGAFGASEGSGYGGFGGAGGAGGDDTSTSTSGTTSSSSTTGSTSTSSSATSGAGGAGGSTPECGDDQHLCGGICAGNTPQTGCFNSVSCAACAAPPINSTATCTAGGDCDFTCNASYQKSGNTCVCAATCCTNAECNGGTCQNGTCTDPPCDPAACLLQCFGMGCFGICSGTDCDCLC